MPPANVKSYRDEIARRHRRVFIFKIIAIVAGTVAVVVALIYFLFFSRIFDVREVSFSGLDTVNSDEFRGKINDKLNQKILKFLPRRNNIFLVNTRNFEAEFATAYPILSSVKVQKKLLHGLIFNFSERKPAGIWCFKESCSYFDDNKILWGQPAKSSGFIFLTVEDRRIKSSWQIDDKFFKPIMEVAKNMAGEVNNIVIPEGSFNEFRAYTAHGYYIIFSTDSDIKNQLDIFKIFLAEKKDSLPAGGFHPQYIDLRIEGRIYYK